MKQGKLWLERLGWFHMELETDIDIDDDKVNEAEEFEAWKAREIARIKRTREEREARRRSKRKEKNSLEGEKEKRMRQMPMELMVDPDDQGSAMEVDDVDPLEIFSEGTISIDNKLVDADFFNNFEDDFDDSNIN
ncbi:hypothetical protein REPUB_Repub06bG0070200 [Reevesia pubescens]